MKRRVADFPHKPYIPGMADDSQKPVRKTFVMSADQAKALENFRFQNRIKSESEAFRQIFDVGVKALSKKAGRQS